MIEYVKDIMQNIITEGDFTTYSGCIDILMIKQSDGSIKSSPFHVRFGKLKVMNPKNHKISLLINDQQLNTHMYIDDNLGAAYFIENNKKSLRIQTKYIIDVKLNRGENTIKYEIQFENNEIQTVQAKLFYFDANQKFVFSDIDGTITKSDVLGHIFAIFGKHYCHDNICELFQKIDTQGYQIIYLTSRPLVFYDYTYASLSQLDQNSIKLPSGPLLLSPDLVLSSLKREIIFKVTDQFKGALLKDLKKLFPENQNPFYAGFGNRNTDAVAYRIGNIQLRNIYIIDESSTIQQLENIKDNYSYMKLSQDIDKYFPNIN